MERNSFDLTLETFHPLGLGVKLRSLMTDLKLADPRSSNNEASRSDRVSDVDYNGKVHSTLHIIHWRQGPIEVTSDRFSFQADQLGYHKT